MMLTLLGLGSMTAMAADRAETIQRKLTDNDYEGARKKCEKWEASNSDVEGSLRDVQRSCHGVQVTPRADCPRGTPRDEHGSMRGA